MDSVLHSLHVAPRTEHVAMCTKSIKCHRLLLLDSVLHSIAQWIEHVAMCTKSIKFHRLLLLDSGLCIAKPWMICICHVTNSIKVQQWGCLFTACWWILEDLGWFLAKVPLRGLGSVYIFGKMSINASYFLKNQEILTFESFRLFCVVNETKVNML